MAMGKRPAEQQETLWIETASLPRTPGHPFYERLNALLDKHGFDAMAQEACARFYADGVGRPSTPPGVYFRMLLIGFFEGIDSERGIAWRTADSMALRAFLGYSLSETTPDHTNLSRTRRRIDLETHQRLFDWVLIVLAKEGLLKGKTLGIDATTLEANAALRSIVRRDTGESYEEFLTGLAKSSGIETPTREDLAKLDKNRPRKGSNKDWESPSDPDARITRMKDGRTHLAHKAEHAVDMETGALVAVTVQGADQGDTATMHETVTRAKASLYHAAQEDAARKGMQPLREAVLDKGYHSNDAVLALEEEHHLRGYISEPKRPRRKWEGNRAAQRAVYANRRRVGGARGRALMRKRGELVERSFAHLYETGRMRRTHLRGRANILKRLLLHAAGFNLSLTLRQSIGYGTARGGQGLQNALEFLLIRLWRALTRQTTPIRLKIAVHHAIAHASCQSRHRVRLRPSATGC
jgi:transposase